MLRILLCSYGSKLQMVLSTALGPEFQVYRESNCERCSEIISTGQCDVVLLDLDTSYSTAEQQLRFFDALVGLGIDIVVLADDEARATATDLIQRGAHSYCRKPPAIRDLKVLIQRAHERTTMRRQLRKPESASTVSHSSETPWCDGLIGASQQMRRVYELVRRVAGLNTSVLITGGSGTGKELIARAIHNTGSRAKSPFIAVSAGAIPETLIESELFGHEKGAFTGSTGTRIGYFEQAGDGTLFLDEIGELSPQTQVKLLRVLQQREFCRLGSSRPIPLKARVIFATHRDLSRMVEEGKFRLDLYYRINVMNIKTPALADHPEDIPLLAEHFIRQYSEICEKRVNGIKMSALTMLAEYDWPGNVRELENVIQGAIIRTDGDSIGPEDLPDHLRESEATEQEECPQIGNFERLLREYKIRLATKAIEDCHGNKTLAARSLNISRAYLHRLIRPEEQENVA